MPSTPRRTFLASSAALVAVAAGGCSALTDSGRPAHTVSVYLGNPDATREVTVTITDESGEVVFDREYSLSEENEAVEDDTFPESTDPATVAVTVDGDRFERGWPGVESEALPCEGENWAGIEVWIEGGPDESPSVRLEATCQHVTVD